MELIYLFAVPLISMALIFSIFDFLGLHAMGVVIWLFVMIAHFMSMGSYSDKQRPRK
jgi:positive regulator of sigma E activity